MKFVTVLVVSLFLLSGIVLGEGLTNKVGLGLKGGVSSYWGDIDDKQIGLYGGLNLSYWISDHFGIGFNVGGGQLQAEKGREYFETVAYHWGPMLRFKPFSGIPLNPFLIAGLEVIHIDPEDEDGMDLPNQQAGEYGNMQFSIPVGLGGYMMLGEDVTLDFEVIYHFANTDYVDDIKRKNFNDGFLQAAVGLSYYLGKAKDSDNDGIPDKVDKDPLKPEDFDGFEDTDGAPDYDNDQDGIPDDVDKAPMDPEDHDGFQDEDGVPDPDNDNDGILDVNDKAPMAAEDVDGFEDEDGAPDTDNDGDGIADADDKCPDDPETFNGYEDQDGCPDTKPEVAVETGQAIVLEGVNFATGSARLTEDSREVMDKVLRTLRDNPGIEIEVRGYTDNTGNLDNNIRLSKQRADAVKNYLVENGIDGARIQTRGLGPENPIAPNDTPEGRAKNRRIEFFRVK